MNVVCVFVRYAFKNLRETTHPATTDHACEKLLKYLNHIKISCGSVVSTNMSKIYENIAYS